MRWFRRRRRSSSITTHYLEHRTTARRYIIARLEFWNTHYAFTYNRVTIRNQRRCWGSCTSLKNLNFSYRLLFLPPDLADYVIVHELCHLAELNHSTAFWAHVAKTIPDYRTRRRALRAYDHMPVRTLAAKTKRKPG